MVVVVVVLGIGRLRDNDDEDDDDASSNGNKGIQPCCRARCKASCHRDNRRLFLFLFHCYCIFYSLFFLGSFSFAAPHVLFVLIYTHNGCLICFGFLLV